MRPRGDGPSRGKPSLTSTTTPRSAFSSPIRIVSSRRPAFTICRRAALTVAGARPMYCSSKEDRGAKSPFRPVNPAMAPCSCARSRVKRIAVTESSGLRAIARSWGRSFSSTKRASASRTRSVLAPGLTWNSSRKNANTRVPFSRAARSSSFSVSIGVAAAGSTRGSVRSSTAPMGRADAVLEDLEVRRTQIQYRPAVGVGHDGVDADRGDRRTPAWRRRSGTGCCGESQAERPVPSASGRRRGTVSRAQSRGPPSAPGPWRHRRTASAARQGVPPATV